MLILKGWYPDWYTVLTHSKHSMKAAGQIDPWGLSGLGIQRLIRSEAGQLCSGSSPEAEE